MEQRMKRQRICVSGHQRLQHLVGIGVVAGVLLLGCTPIVAPAGDPATDATPGTSAVATPDPSATPLPTEEPEAEESPMPATPAESAAPEAADPVEQAKADLAERLSVAMDAIDVVEVRDVAWRDGSMGCPQPDMMYTQVIIEGMKIILAVDGEEYHYHSGRNRDPFFCENPAEDGAVGS